MIYYKILVGKLKNYLFINRNRFRLFITQPCKGDTLLACAMVWNRSWHLPRNPKLVWHPARLIKEGGRVDLSVDAMHLKDPSVIVGFEGSALSLLSPRIDMLCNCSSTMTEDHFLEKRNVMALSGLCVPMCL